MDFADGMISLYFIYHSHVIHDAPFFLQPMLEADNPLQAYFPERKFALVIPAALLVVAFGIGGLFVAAVLIRGAVQKKKSS